MTAALSAEVRGQGPGERTGEAVAATDVDWEELRAEIEVVAWPPDGGIAQADLAPSPRAPGLPRSVPSSGPPGRPARERAAASVGAGPERAVAAATSRDRSGCTVPQLKRFIKSRVYVPLHELRRRFGIDGSDDDVTPISVGGEQLYVGLPDREGRLLAELLRSGDVGYELSHDPPTPIVVGLYPMRPIPRS